MRISTLLGVCLPLLAPVFVNSAFADMTESNLVTAKDRQGLNNNNNIDELSKNSSWHRLLLYKNGESRVLDSDFFISKEGKRDPNAELLAGMQALNNAATAEDYLCRFPARSNWLMSQIPSLQDNLESLIGTSSCAKVDEWMQTVNASQLSLIHAEEHVNRIGSSLGHTLVRVDNSKSLASNNTDDAYFLNFATDEDIAVEQGFKAKLNALRGQGIGSMTFGKYTSKQENYLLTDQRDIWQYQLDLPQETVNQIMRQLWEVKSAYRYYNFLSYNCASEVLRLIDAAIPDSDLVSEAGRIVSPAEVSRLLDKHGLLKKQLFVPSLRTVKQADLNNKNNFNDLNIQESAAQFAVQAKKSSLPTLTPSQNNPLNANPIHRVKLGIKHSADYDKNTFVFGMRGAYQDLLDSPAGKRDFLNSTLLSMDLSYSDEEDKVKVEEATLIELLLLNPKNSTDPKSSLGGHLKITPVTDASDSKNEEHRVVSLGAEYGASWFIGSGKSGTGEAPNKVCYALGDVKGQVGHINKGYRVGLGLHTGCVYYVNDKLRIMADARLPYWYQGNNNSLDTSLDKKIEPRIETRDHYFQPKLSLVGQYDFANHRAIRGSIEQQKNYDKEDTSYKLSYHWFFD